MDERAHLLVRVDFYRFDRQFPVYPIKRQNLDRNLRVINDHRLKHKYHLVSQIWNSHDRNYMKESIENNHIYIFSNHKSMNLMLGFPNLLMVQTIVPQSNIKSIHQIQINDYFKHTRNDACEASTTGATSCCSVGAEEGTSSTFNGKDETAYDSSK
jgi:hypothetical protein